MIDTLNQNIHRIVKPSFWDSHNIAEQGYMLLTLYRPSKADDPEKLTDILHSIVQSTNGFPIVFPVHLRTKQVLSQTNFINNSSS